MKLYNYRMRRVLIKDKGGKILLSIAICDDQEQEVEEMYQMVHEVVCDYSVPYKIIKCSNGEDLIYELGEYGSFDLIFMDVELKRDNGVEVAKRIREKDPYCKIVFVSGYNQYYKSAFSVQPFQFIDKPINQDEFKEITRAAIKHIVNENEVFSFENKWKHYRISLKDILYFTSEHRIVRVYTKDGNQFEFYGKMNDVETVLEQISTAFLRVHKSHLLNMNYIKVLQRDVVVLQDDSELMVSARRRKEVLERYMAYATHNSIYQMK